MHLQGGPGFFRIFLFFIVFFVVLGSVAKTTHTGISLRAEAAHGVNRCVPLHAEAAQRLQLAACFLRTEAANIVNSSISLRAEAAKAVDICNSFDAEAPPPFANTVLASWVWRASHAFKQALPGLKKRGVGGGAARLKKKKRAAPPPPPFANTVFASWVRRAWHAFKQALPGLKKRGVGGAQPCKHSVSEREGGSGTTCEEPCFMRKWKEADLRLTRVVYPDPRSGTTCEEPCFVTKWKEADLRPYEGRLPRPLGSRQEDNRPTD